MNLDNADTALLREFMEAWNRHDADAVMEFFAADAVFVGARGPLPDGHRMVGTEAIREGVVSRLEAVPDLAFVDDEYVPCGPGTVFSSWTMTGHAADGAAIEVRGCDLYRVADGKVTLKDSFLKAQA